MVPVSASVVTEIHPPIDLSIVIPAYNEESRLGKTLEQMQRYLMQDQCPWKSGEIIVVCDGCNDATEAVARRMQHATGSHFRVISYARNQGKGYALRRGVLASRGRLVLIMDADGSSMLAESEVLAKPIGDGTTDIAIGSRRIAGARINDPQPLHRRFMGFTFGWMMRRILGMPFRDTQCGFKLFSGPAGRRLFERCKCRHFAIDIEMLFWARKTGLRVVEIGVVWNDVVGSHVRPVRDALKMLGYALYLRSFRRDAA